MYTRVGLYRGQGDNPSALPAHTDAACDSDLERCRCHDAFDTE